MKLHIKVLFKVHVEVGVFDVQVDPFTDLYIFNTLPFDHPATTKLTVKYHHVTMSELLLAHASTVNKIFLVSNHSVDAGNHTSPKLAPPVDHEATLVGANKIPFHVVEAITNPLVGI